MSDDPRGKTGRLGTGPLRPEYQATQIYHHQRQADAFSQYAPVVIPMLKRVLEDVFGETPGYGVDDNIDADSDSMRFGWRIFGLAAGESRFRGETPDAPQRKTLLSVELRFGEQGQPVGFIVDTRRTHTTIKTGLLGLKQKITSTKGSMRQVTLSETELAEALDELSKTMER